MTFNDISEHKYLFHEGKNYRAYEFLGVHRIRGKRLSAQGASNGDCDPVCKKEASTDNSSFVFRVWAPRAKAVSLVGAFNDWDRTKNPMQRLADDDSIWEVVIPACSGGRAEKNALDAQEKSSAIDESETSIYLKEGDLYKFAVEGQDGRVVFKADPYAFWSESTPFDEGGQRASVIWTIDEERLQQGDGMAEGSCAGGLMKRYEWNDEEYLKRRAERNPYASPMNIYEVHLGSWRRPEQAHTTVGAGDAACGNYSEGSDDKKNYYNYEELADLLIPYVKDMGYTHIELLPVMEHPYDGSWGYQVTGYYSVTSRYGTPDQFKYLINKAHEADIGVILDWVPAHFPKDEHGLIEFDGEPLYEYTDPLKKEHKGWGTLSFDFGRPEVVSFLTSNAYFYCSEYHADGLRVDAVSAMLYLNYDREEGEWAPNDEGGMENKEAISFLQTVNQNVLTEYPGVIMIAEESTAFPNVTKPPSVGGLGFNFKWNMGWMNDALDYISIDPLFRGGSHYKLTFSIAYAYSENFILPISHDEVVHGKHSLLDKMPGSYDEKFAGFRAFLIYMMTHPGKKLTFMGTEFGQFIEWNEKQELDWVLMLYPQHKKTQEFVKALNHIYRETPAFWSQDDSYDSFDWVDADNSASSVYTYIRKQTVGKEGEWNGISHPLMPGLVEIDEAERPTYLIALNMSGIDFPEYRIGVPDGDCFELVISSSDVRYGGPGTEHLSGDSTRRASEYQAGESCARGNAEAAETYKIEEGYCNGYEQHISIPLPKFSAVILQRRK